jgi:7-carboxy-7-deazaguanine synthase (Cx14CxxC type)
VTYAVKEIFYSLQGEGSRTGRPAVFLRFAGCNLWSGREADRATAICKFCDTDFVCGTKYATAWQLATTVAAHWPGGGNAYVVVTGGEPMLQLDADLVTQLRIRGFEVAIETNGTIPVIDVDWICVSPKANTDIVQRTGDELKLVYPQESLRPDQVSDMKFDNWYLQPMDGDMIKHNTQDAIDYCLEHTRWSLSLQSHKLWGLR